MLPQAIAEFAGIEADARLVRSRCRAGESGPGTGGHITKPSWLHEHIRQPVTNLGRRLKFCFVLAYHISERERRSRTHEAETISGFSVLAVCTVGTSRSRAPCGRSRNRLGLSGKCFLKQLPNSPGSRPMPGWSVPGAEPDRVQSRNGRSHNEALLVA